MPLSASNGNSKLYNRWNHHCAAKKIIATKDSEIQILDYKFASPSSLQLSNADHWRVESWYFDPTNLILYCLKGGESHMPPHRMFYIFNLLIWKHSHAWQISPSAQLGWILLHGGWFPPILRSQVIVKRLLAWQWERVESSNCELNICRRVVEQRCHASSSTSVQCFNAPAPFSFILF